MSWLFGKFFCIASVLGVVSSGGFSYAEEPTTEGGFIRNTLEHLAFDIRQNGSRQVIEQAISFSVQNVNRSGSPCLSDGQTYTIQGYLVYPAGQGIRDAVTLYLHGFGWGEFFWRFKDVPGFDYATEMAQLGHVSVVIDRLGYDESGHPAGAFSACLGSQADVAHQIVQQLRSGSYQTEGNEAFRFQRVALAGHSAGGAVAEIEAYSFQDIDALLVMAWTDLGVSPAALLALGTASLGCLLGGEPAEPGLPGGYAFFGQTPEDFLRLELSDADPAVRSVVALRRNRDPCGDLTSSPIALGTDIVNITVLRSIQVPTLLVCGELDRVFPPPACDIQSILMSPISDLTSVTLNGIGHGLTLERSTVQFRNLVSDWLRTRGF